MNTKAVILIVVVGGLMFAVLAVFAVATVLFLAAPGGEGFEAEFVETPMLEESASVTETLDDVSPQSLPNDSS